MNKISVFDFAIVVCQWWKSILDLLVRAHPERVGFGLSLASSSCELMNASITSLRSYVLEFLSVGCPAIRGLCCCNQCNTITFTLLFAFILRSEGLTAQTFKARRGF